jgi:uncharacterized protein YkwD
MPILLLAVIFLAGCAAFTSQEPINNPNEVGEDGEKEPEIEIEGEEPSTPSKPSKPSTPPTPPIREEKKSKANEKAITDSYIQVEKFDITDIVNRKRSEGRTCNHTGRFFKAGRPVSWNSKLANAAARHSRHMATYDHFEHKGKDGSTLASRIHDAGYSYCLVAENIGKNYANASAVVEGWIESETGHCENVMNPSVTEIGAAVAYNGTSTYWTLVLGRPYKDDQPCP